MHASLISITPDILSFPSIPPGVPDLRGTHLKAYVATLHHVETPPKWSSYFRLIDLNDTHETCSTKRGSFGIEQDREPHLGAVGSSHVLSDRGRVEDLLTPIDDGLSLRFCLSLT